MEVEEVDPGADKTGVALAPAPFLPSPELGVPAVPEEVSPVFFPVAPVTVTDPGAGFGEPGLELLGRVLDEVVDDCGAGCAAGCVAFEDGADGTGIGAGTVCSVVSVCGVVFSLGVSRTKKNQIISAITAAINTPKIAYNIALVVVLSSSSSTTMGATGATGATGGKLS